MLQFNEFIICWMGKLETIGGETEYTTSHEHYISGCIPPFSWFESEVLLS